MKALIKDNLVVDIAEVEFEVHPSQTWMDCPDECAVGAWEVVDGTLQAIPEPEDIRTYAEKRRQEYPSIEDQLDKIYHDGVTKWKSEMIKPVKDAHPKPE
tara:strand:- start:213 stop:512 length:300 start_codon:yes stop_codon:yes gene_type:complete